jgi:hypothetical protein
MKRRTLGVLAIILIALMTIVALAGLDNLPRQVLASVENTGKVVASDRSQFDDSRTHITRAISSDPDLFRTQAAAWQAKLSDADSKLRQADAEMQRVRELAKHNRREDRQQIEDELKRVDSLRTEALTTAKDLRAETDRWVGYKKNLPAQLSAMKTAYEALQAFDIRTQASAAQKALVDWPAKKDDLERRFSSLEGLKKQGEEAWASVASERAKAERGETSGINYSALFAAGEAISEDLKEVQRGAGTLNELAGQLYTSRDKVLLELDNDKTPREKVRVVETKYPDASLQNGQAATREEWQTVTDTRFSDLKRSIGMTVEHKPAGKYDSEADRNIQPPGYAYIAPPGQANQYGRWNNGVWSWLPQYLILSQLLRTTSYPPISVGDYYDYGRYRQSGTIWHGRSGEYGSTWSGGGRSGSWTDRLRSWGSGTSSQGGGTISNGSTRPRHDTWNTGGSTYGGSKYESRGGFGGSKYQSRPSGGFGGGGFGSRSYSRGGSFSRGMSRGGRR